LAANREVVALQAALEAEHHAVYGYGIGGAQLADRERDDARAALAAHEARRDALAALVTGRGATPVVADPAYRSRRPVTDRTTALRLLVRLEDASTVGYVRVLGATSEVGVRRSAVGWLVDTSVRAQRWRARLSAAATMPPLPGLTAPTAAPSPGTPATPSA